MSYSSIIQKPCKCGCGSMPTLGFQGYFSGCRPDLVAEKIKKNNSRQYQKGKLNKAVREQLQNGDFEDASRQALINDLDYVHSRVVRMTAADLTGGASCFTCGVYLHWSIMQLSHFIPRANTFTRWDFKANRCCCKNCNENLGGNLKVFAQRLNEEQSGLAEQLTEMGKEVYKWGIDELKQLLTDQRAKLRIIETKFKPINV